MSRITPRSLPLSVYGDVQRISRIFNWIAASILFGQGAGILIVLTTANTSFAFIILASIPPMLAVFILIRHNRLEMSAVLMAVIALTMLTAIATAGLGIHNIGNIAFPTIMIVASLVIRKRTMVILTLFAVACAAWLVFGELSGAFTPKALEQSVPGDFLSTALVIVLTAFMVRLLAEALFRDNIRLQEELAERRRAEEALRESEGKYRLLVEHSTQGVLLYEDQRLVYGNSRICEIFGYDTAELAVILPLRASELVHPDDRASVAERSRRYANGEPVNEATSYRIVRKNGEIRQVEGYAASFVLEGKTAGLVTMVDVTDRKRAEEEQQKLQVQLNQAQKMELVGRLAGGVAHDFNNLLQVILGQAEAALEDLAPGVPFYEELHEIQNAARQSAELTRQLLAFARKQEVVPRPMDLNQAVPGMLTMLQRLIGEEIKLAWKPGPDLWPVAMDPSQLDQVLANLSTNARDAIAGSGKIFLSTENVSLEESWCRVHAGSVPGQYVLLEVTDSGTGMSQDALDHLFEPFFTTKGVGRGTGLGLATVYGIVKQNNGFITVSSEAAHGSTFGIYLPRSRDAVEPRPAPQERGPARGSEVVLLVEDEESILKLTGTMLERLGYTVLPARSPAQALDLAERHGGPLHLLLTDVVMPEMNGRELHAKAAVRRPGLKVLFMSGYTADVIAQRGVIDEGLEFLQKPFSLQALSIKVRDVLDRT